MLWLRDVLGLPSAISYITDAILIWILMLHMNRILHGNRYAYSKTQVRIVAMIIVAIVFGVVINLVNPLLVIWATRNNLRFFAFFFACIGLLNTDDVDQLIALFFGFFWINVIVCTAQYYGQGLSGDQLGGLFGTKTGSNSYMNILLCIISSVAFAKYFDGKMGIVYLSVCVIACVYIAVLSELKAFYLEIVFILIGALILRGTSWKTLLSCVLGVLGVGALLSILSIYDPRTIETFLDADAMEVYLAGEGYTQSGDLNRFTAIQQINDRFFAGKPLKLLFGFGFGNCEISQLDFFFSEFGRQYMHLHYRWFTHAWVFLEQGAVGLILLVVFFISLLVTIIKRRAFLRQDLVIAAFCFATTCIFGMIYNCALQLEAGYMIAFMCAIPYIASKEVKENLGGHKFSKTQRITLRIKKRM